SRLTWTRESLPRRPLSRAPRRPLPRGAGRPRWAVLHAGRVERRAPAALVVLRQLEIETLTVHPHGDVADAGPGIEPGAQRVQRAVVREHRAAGKADRRHEEPTALVEHALLEELVRLEQERLGDGQPQTLGGFEIDHQLELGRLLDREIGRLGALQDLV